ncbi:MAG: response regulator [Rhodothermales bacterium]|nr:response regulator [Rhodothermales bacterium]MBO6778117.1 response regulator [Rhodothermales bacterium]
MAGILSRWMALNRAESDLEFRDLNRDLNIRGLRTTALLGILLVVTYVGVLYASGRPFSWWSHEGSVALWDKLLVFLLAGAALVFSTTPAGGSGARVVVAVLCIGAGLTSILDDISRPNTDFSTPWIAIALFVAVGTVSFRPAQAAVLSVSAVLLYVVPVSWAGIAADSGQMIFIMTMASAAFASSTLLYSARLRLFETAAESRRIARERDRAAAALDELEQRKSRFFFGLAHDIRTPLSLMLGPVRDVLSGAAGTVDQQAAHHLAIARDAGVRLNGLVADMLDLSRVEVGELGLELDSYDLRALTESVVLEYQPAAERKELRLEFEAPGEPVATEIDPARIRQVVGNLISNAVKFVPRGGLVRVRAAGDEHWGRVTVADNGPGIPADQQARVFDRYHRVAGSESGGTGIGLSLVAEFVALHGGQVELTSEPGFGCRFDVRLPLSDEPMRPLPSFDNPLSTQISDRTDSSNQAGSTGPHVLIVDDNEHILDYLTTVLSPTCRPIKARDGAEAWKALDEHEFDLVITDVMMPEIDGIELCRRVRNSGRLAGLPVVLLTALDDEESRLAGLAAGADDFLTKPFSSRELLYRVENLIHIRNRIAQKTAVRLGTSELQLEDRHAAFVEQLTSIAEEHLGNAAFGVEWLADEMSLSPRQLQRRVKGALGLTTSAFLRMLRLQTAATLLERQSSVASAASRVGFRDADHFAKLFRQMYGVPPSAYANATACPDATIVFVDVRGFTTFAEERTPDEVADFLQGLFELLTPPVREQGGIVHQLLGDGLMAVFGAPETLPNSGISAIHAVDQMFAAVRRGVLEGHLPETRLGAGVHGGPVRAGLLGPHGRQTFAFTGDAVNVAARIEGLNRQLGTDVLLSETVASRLPANLSARLTDRGVFPIRGRRTTHRLFSLDSAGSNP